MVADQPAREADQDRRYVASQMAEVPREILSLITP